jgi:hypothetical protein
VGSGFESARPCQDFLRGLMGVKTVCDDKHSDPTDLEYLCFDVNQRAAVYVLYDKRATGRPTWPKSEFSNQHIAVVDDNTADKFGGLYEICPGRPGALNRPLRFPL